MKLSAKQPHMENRLVAKGRALGRMGWESGASRCKLVYVGWINKALLHGRGNRVQCPVINYKGKESKKRD